MKCGECNGMIEKGERCFCVDCQVVVHVNCHERHLRRHDLEFSRDSYSEVMLWKKRIY